MTGPSIRQVACGPPLKIRLTRALNRQKRRYGSDRGDLTTGLRDCLMSMRTSMANRWLTRAFAMVLVITLGGLFAAPAMAKKPRPAAPAETDTPSADGQPATKAQLAATVSLASIKISRAALADDASLAD